MTHDPEESEDQVSDPLSDLESAIDSRCDCTGGPECRRCKRERAALAAIRARLAEAERERDEAHAAGMLEGQRQVSIWATRAAALAEKGAAYAAAEAEQRARAEAAEALNAELVDALKRARAAMQNEWHGKPRIGMESECAAADAVLERARTK